MDVCYMAVINLGTNWLVVIGKLTEHSDASTKRQDTSEPYHYFNLSLSFASAILYLPLMFVAVGRSKNKYCARCIGRETFYTYLWTFWHPLPKIHQKDNTAVFKCHKYLSTIDKLEGASHEDKNLGWHSISKKWFLLSSL